MRLMEMRSTRLQGSLNHLRKQDHVAGRSRLRRKALAHNQYQTRKASRYWKGRQDRWCLMDRMYQRADLGHRLSLGR